MDELKLVQVQLREQGLLGFIQNIAIALEVSELEIVLLLGSQVALVVGPHWDEALHRRLVETLGITPGILTRLLGVVILGPLLHLILHVDQVLVLKLKHLLLILLIHIILGLEQLGLGLLLLLLLAELLLLLLRELLLPEELLLLLLGHVSHLGSGIGH